MVISDSKTGEAFRAEVLAEIDRRLTYIASDAKHARTQRDQKAATARGGELRDLRAFLASITFADLPKGGEPAFS
jgi:hypothetical protein